MASEKLFTRNDDRVIRFNASFVYLVRSLTMLEGTCKLLDPDFNFATSFRQIQPLLQLQAFRPMEVLQEVVASPQMLRSLSNAVLEQEEMLDAAFGAMRDMQAKQQLTQLLLITSVLLSTFLVIA